MSSYGIPPRFQAAALADFPEAVRRAVGDAAEVAGECGGYYIHGPVGTGKTHLACAILREWIERGVASVTTSTRFGYSETRALFAHAGSFLAALQRTFRAVPGQPSEAAIVLPLRRARALALDDLRAACNRLGPGCAWRVG